MGVMGLVFAVLPGIAFSMWLLMECPMKAKVLIHKMPVFISSTLVAMVIGTTFSGVIGPYAGCLCDLILIPVMWWDKHKIVQPYLERLESEKQRIIREQGYAEEKIKEETKIHLDFDLYAMGKNMARGADKVANKFGKIIGFFNPRIW